MFAVALKVISLTDHVARIILPVYYSITSRGSTKRIGMIVHFPAYILSVSSHSFFPEIITIDEPIAAGVISRWITHLIAIFGSN